MFLVDVVCLLSQNAGEGLDLREKSGSFRRIAPVLAFCLK